MFRIIIDTETTGNPQNANTLHVYDLGFTVVDNAFNVVEKHSYIISDVFYGMPYEMESAYYASKKPQYEQDIINGIHTVKSFLDVKNEFAAVCKKYSVKQVWAFNAAFDEKALNNTVKTLSNGFCRYFFPFGVQICDIAPCAVEILCCTGKYFQFVTENGMVSDKGNIRTTAESIYAYLSGNGAYIEKHTALEDAIIETAILEVCFKRKRKMNHKPRPAWQIPQKAYKKWLSKR